MKHTFFEKVGKIFRDSEIRGKYIIGFGDGHPWIWVRWLPVAFLTNNFPWATCPRSLRMPLSKELL